MKLFGAVAVLVAVSGAWAGDAGQMSKPLVTVCLKTGANAALFNRAEGVAAHILKGAGVRIEWRTDEASCASAEHGIVVSVMLATAADLHPGALAYAMPYERTRIVLFYDRVANSVRPAVVPFLMGHVLAHEIGHMLQGVSQHAAGGIMKSRWDAGDFADMQRGRLAFTEEDISLIHHNLNRNPRPAPAE